MSETDVPVGAQSAPKGGAQPDDRAAPRVKRPGVRPPAYRLFRVLVSGPVVFTVVIFLVGALVTRQDILLQGSVALTYAIASTGLGLALGLAGEFLLGQLFLFAVSAYVTASLVTNHAWSFWPAAGMGIISATVVGLALSVIGLRVSRFYFALVGFFLVSLLPNIVQIFHSETGGTAGLAVPTAPSLFGTQFGTRQLFLLAAVFLILTLVLVRNVREAPLGIQMRRMRENPVTVMSSGVPIWHIRVSAYVLSSVLAGIGGAIYCELFAFVLPNFFDLTTTILLFAAVLVGGATTLMGPSLGVILLYVIPTIVINVQSYSDLIYGGTVLISAIAFRGGVERAVIDFFHWLRRRGQDQRRVHEELARASELASANGSGAAAGEWSDHDLAEMLWSIREGVKPSGPLVVRGARKRFGGVAALDMEDDEEVSLLPGQVHLLLGPNGSGKTTLLNATSGLARLDGGTVTFGDRGITRLAPARIAKLGIGRSFQSPSVPPEVTPRELLGALLAQLKRVSYVHWLTSDWIAVRARRQSREQAGRILTAAGLRQAMDHPCTALTSGQSRILDVVIALSSKSTMVMLDEPAAGLSETERKQLGATIRSLAARGLGFLVVEHDLELALNIADRVTVLGQGHVLASGTPDHIRDHPGVREVLIGAPA